MKYRRVEAHFHAFPLSALNGGEWPVSRPSRFTLGEKIPCRESNPGQARRFLTAIFYYRWQQFSAMAYKHCQWLYGHMTKFIIW